MKHLILICVLFLMASSVAQAQSEGVRQKNFNLKKTLAIDGYDPVSYFDNKPEEGSSKQEFIYKGVVYRFVSAANLDKFRSSPEKYEPAYGGWCAYAMGENGEKVKVDPETYKILNGKLYLFYNFWGNNTLNGWNKNENSLKDKGDQIWKKFVKFEF